MKILYVSFYPKKYFESILENSEIRTSLPGQRFNQLIGEGLDKSGNDVDVICSNHFANETNGLYFKPQIVEEANFKYKIFPKLKIRFIGSFFESQYAYYYTKKWLKKNNEGIVIIDILKPYASSISRAVNNSKNRVCVAIVTDLPEYLTYETKSILDKISVYFNKKRCNDTLKNASSYIFLTEQMNKKLNIYNKPYEVIEGFVDSDIINEKINNNIYKSSKIVMYSGELSKQYGLDRLVLGFINGNFEDAELHLYGNGDYVEEIKLIAENNNRVKYFGIVMNEIVVEKQKQATVLVNPRPSDAEYTKYSFPSKNMEYMASGTYVITTKLPGMPEEYLKYVEIIEDESTQGITEVLKNVLYKSKDDLFNLGLLSKRFVLENKNNIIQCKKIIRMVSEINE